MTRKVSTLQSKVGEIETDNCDKDTQLTIYYTSLQYRITHPSALTFTARLPTT
jgi:hypothetical protein